MHGSDRSSKHIADVAVVGGGIVALALAWEFVRRDRTVKVALVAPTSSTGSASHASGAMLSGYGETTSFSQLSEAGRQKATWRIDAANRWPGWISELAEQVRDDSLCLSAGTIVFSNSVSGPLDQANLRAIVDLLRKHGKPVEQVDPIDMGFCPSLADRPMQAIYLRDECHVDSAKVLSALRKQLVASPALTWVAENCIEIKKMPGDLTGYTLTTAERQIHAEQVIIAAGASSLLPIKAEVELLARIPPLFCGAGAAIVCESARPTNLFKFALRTPNRAFACGLHAVPLDDRRVYIGATSNIRLGASAHPFLSDVGFLVECAVHQIDRRLASFNLTELRVGNRPVSLDGFPLVGQTSLPGLWIATGTYRDGFLLAPLIAQQVFDALLARHSVITGRELFAPERAPLQQGSKDEIIKVAIENYVAIALERRARFPAVGGWEDLFREQTSERVQETYRRIGSSYFAPPDFLWDIESDGLHDFFSEAYKTSETIWGVA